MCLPGRYDFHENSEKLSLHNTKIQEKAAKPTIAIRVPAKSQKRSQIGDAMTKKLCSTHGAPPTSHIIIFVR